MAPRLRLLALAAAVVLGPGGCALVNAGGSSSGNAGDPADPDDPDEDTIDDGDDDPNAGGFILKLGEDALDTPIAIAARDIAGQGAPDVAVLDVAAQRAHLFINDGAAHFEDHYAAAPASGGFLFAGTYLADGETMPGRDLAYVSNQGQMSVVDGDGHGGLHERSPGLAVAPSLMAPIAFDAGGDGILMIDTAGAFLPLHPIGNGSFGADTGPNPPGSITLRSLRTADVDGDGDLDALLAAHDSVWISLYDLDAFQPWDDLVDLGVGVDGEAIDVAVGDFIAGDLDEIVVLVEGTDEPLVVFEWGGEEYNPSDELDPTIRATSIASGDADGDGRPDLFAFDAGAGQVHVLLAGIERDYAERVDLDTAPPVDWAVADFDDDGRDDFAVVSGAQVDGTLEVWCSRIAPPED